MTGRALCPAGIGPRRVERLSARQRRELRRLVGHSDGGAVTETMAAIGHRATFATWSLSAVMMALLVVLGAEPWPLLPCLVAVTWLASWLVSVFSTPLPTSFREVWCVEPAPGLSAFVVVEAAKDAPGEWEVTAVVEKSHSGLAEPLVAAVCADADARNRVLRVRRVSRSRQPSDRPRWRPAALAAYGFYPGQAWFWRPPGRRPGLSSAQ